MSQPRDPERLLSSWHEGLGELYESDTTEISDSEKYPGESDDTGDSARYLELEPLGAGGQKRISVTEDQETGRRVAMARPKEIDPEHRARFVREIKLTSRFRHPNIVAVHDVGEDDEGPFAVMALIGGASLREVRKQWTKNFPESVLDRQLQVLLKVCDALAYAHAQGVLHLDVKPSNIQVGEFGDVYLLDWGLARLVGEQNEEWVGFSESDRDLLNDMTLTGTVKGTPGFMAPEQASPDGTTTVATDLYALGALLHFMTTGDPPVQGDTYTDVISRTKLGETEIDKSLSGSLASIVAKATALEPSDRYANVDAFRRDVERFRHGYATAAENAGLGKQLGLLYRRNRSTCNLVALMVAILVVGSTAFVQSLRQSRNQALLSEQNATAAKITAQQARKLAESANQKMVRANAKIENLHRKQLSQFMNIGAILKPITSIRAAEELIATQRSIYGDKPHLMLALQRCLFIRQKFDDLLDVQPVNEEMQVLHDLAKPYAHGGHAPLRLTDLSQLMRDLVAANQFRIAVKILYHDNDFPHNRKRDYLKPVTAVLESLNPGWDSSGVQYLAGQGVLRLRGQALKHLSDTTDFPYSPLHILHVKHLDLRNTGISDLHQIGTMDLYSLDVRQTPISDLRRLRWSTQLTEITVEPDRFSADKLKQLSPRTQVVEVSSFLNRP